MSCSEKNSFSDISQCKNLPLDNAFNNYNKKGGGDVVSGAVELLSEVATKSRLPEIKSALNKYNLTGGKRSKRGQRGGRESNGYYLAVDKPNIGGRPVVEPYSTCAAPVFDTGCRDLRGGGKRRKKRRKLC